MSMTENSKDMRTPLEGSLSEGGGTLVLGKLSLESVKLMSDDGASGLVYEAVCPGYYGEDSAAARFVIKECYPISCAHGITREGASLVVSPGVQGSFDLYEKRYINAFVNHAVLYQGAAREQTTVPCKAYQANGTVYIVVDASNGKVLSEAIADMSPEVQVRMLVRLCEAIAALHDEGYVYLDLKPSNIMVLLKADAGETYVYSGEIKLFDFDTVTCIEDLSAEGAMLTGSGEWSAWEQAHPGHAEQVGVQSDIYSIGVLLFWLEFGRSPQASEVIMNDGDWHISAKAGNGSPLTSGARALAAFNRVLSKAITTDPEMRFKNARELKAALQSLEDAIAPATPPIVEELATQSAMMRGGFEGINQRLDMMQELLVPTGGMRISEEKSVTKELSPWPEDLVTHGTLEDLDDWKGSGAEPPSLDLLSSEQLRALASVAYFLDLGVLPRFLVDCGCIEDALVLGSLEKAGFLEKSPSTGLYRKVGLEDSEAVDITADIVKLFNICGEEIMGEVLAALHSVMVPYDFTWLGEYVGELFDAMYLCLRETDIRPELYFENVYSYLTRCFPNKREEARQITAGAKDWGLSPKQKISMIVFTKLALDDDSELEALTAEAEKCARNCEDVESCLFICAHAFHYGLRGELFDIARTKFTNVSESEITHAMRWSMYDILKNAGREKEAAELLIESSNVNSRIHARITLSTLVLDDRSEYRRILDENIADAIKNIDDVYSGPLIGILYETIAYPVDTFDIEDLLLLISKAMQSSRFENEAHLFINAKRMSACTAKECSIYLSLLEHLEKQDRFGNYFIWFLDLVKEQIFYRMGDKNQVFRLREKSYKTLESLNGMQLVAIGERQWSDCREWELLDLPIEECVKNLKNYIDVFREDCPSGSAPGDIEWELLGILFGDLFPRMYVRFFERISDNEKYANYISELIEYALSLKTDLQSYEVNLHRQIIISGLLHLLKYMEGCDTHYELFLRAEKALKEQGDADEILDMKIEYAYAAGEYKDATVALRNFLDLGRQIGRIDSKLYVEVCAHAEDAGLALELMSRLFEPIQSNRNCESLRDLCGSRGELPDWMGDLVQDCTDTAEAAYTCWCEVMAELCAKAAKERKNK